MLANDRGRKIQDPGTASGMTELPVPWIGQMPYRNWCWAACCAMLLTADGLPTTIYNAARTVLGDPPRDIPMDPREALNAIDLSWQQPPQDGGAPLDATSLRQQVIDGRKPAELYWEYENYSGHVGLVTGYDATNQTWRLLDPLLGIGSVSYQYLYTYHGSASWQNTLYAIGARLGNPT